MSDLNTVEDVCQEGDITLVVHPSIRKALLGFEEDFLIPAAAFLQGGGRAAYFLPLQGGGDVKLGDVGGVGHGGLLTRVGSSA